jgi:tetratricopeptide (TPR) repeat protein
MSHDFTLIIEAGRNPAQATLRLLDAQSNFLAANEVDFDQFSISQRQALYDLRHFVSFYHDANKEAEVIAKTGLFIAENVMGEAIFRHLYLSQSARTLHIVVPGSVGNKKADAFHGALGRIAWEIARPSVTGQPLSERALHVIMTHEMVQPASKPLPLPTGPDDMLRVLFIFAEAQGSTPLGMRQERRALHDLFQHKIYPNRLIEAHFLAHGVTRAQLQRQIREHHGYHIVHWSGHGHQNALELAKPGGTKDILTGEELLALFHRAGGTIPRLCFLSACNSGNSAMVENWYDFLHGDERHRADRSAAMLKDIDVTRPPALTGTAQALLHGGVPSVVAMRYEVGDDYARELALAFYQCLLADAQPKSLATALAQAREQVRAASAAGTSRFNPCDYATPLLLGVDQIGLAGKPGRSQAGKVVRRCLPAIGEFRAQSNFVGRTWELTALGSDFIDFDSTQAVAQITGLGGMGKTSLTAEVIDLWQARFDWVLLFQAKPHALGLDSFFSDVHMHLDGMLKDYHKHVKANPADAIYRPRSGFADAAMRLQLLVENLLLAMQNDAILLVLDNFETNLKPEAEPDGNWASKDPEWDQFLRLLTQGLAQNTTRSRLLINCRRPLAALAGLAFHWLQLGPLPASEARLYLGQHPQLEQMLFGTDEDEKALAQRVLQASRFHPLLMDRLARLCANLDHRPQLLQALQTLELRHDYSQLPELFASQPGDRMELVYLQDALEYSIDELIRHADKEACWVLWIAALANEAVTFALLETVCIGNNAVLARIQKLKTLLTKLVSVGLLDEHRIEPNEKNFGYSCHELVRERIIIFIQGQANPDPKPIWLDYAKHLYTFFKMLETSDVTAAFQIGVRAVVYCAQAQAYDALSQIASAVVSSSIDMRSLQGLIPHLQEAANSAPKGEARWSCLACLADTLCRGGYPEASLPIYQQAAYQAHTFAQTSSGDSAAWTDFAWISGNWAHALSDCGQHISARERLLACTAAQKKAGELPLTIIGSELEALRIDILQGEVGSAIPQIETRLTQVARWWKQHQTGQAVPEAPDVVILARTFISALGIAANADFVKADWPSALVRIETILQVQQALHLSPQDIAATRIDYANVLAQLRRFDDAKAELETCLNTFDADPASKARVLTAIAALFAQQSDLPQAIAQERRALALLAPLFAPQECGISHANLANYLEKSTETTIQVGSNNHQLAALIYFLCTDHQLYLQVTLRNYAIRFYQAHINHTVLSIPRISRLLIQSDFHPLSTWLHQWLPQNQSDLIQLQADVDALLENVKTQALAQQ